MEHQTRAAGNSSAAKRWDLAFLALLLLLMCATRIPLASRMLYHYDSVVFAVAMEGYDPTPLGAPHPPGYIFYIGVANLAQLLFPDANDALVFISIVFEFLTVALLYRFCVEALNRTYGVVASLGLLYSPLFWFHGEVALSYPLESFFGILVARYLYHAASGNRRALYLGAASLALAGGFRTFATVMLMPLLVYAIVVAHRKWKPVLLVAAILIACGLTWYVPSVIYGGGPQEHMAYSRHFWSRFLRTTSIFYGATPVKAFKQLLLIGETGFSALWFFAPPLIFLHLKRIVQWWFRITARIQHSGIADAFAAARRVVGCAVRRNDPFLFISVLIVPAGLFLALFHFSQRGHIFLFLPLLFLPVVRALEEVVPFRTKTPWIALLAAVCLALNGLSYLAIAPSNTGMMTSEASDGLVDHVKFRLLNNFNNWIFNSSDAAIRLNDRTRIDFKTIRDAKAYSPGNTVIVTKRDTRFKNLFTTSYYQHVRYYMPEYRCYEIRLGSTRLPTADPGLTVLQPALTFTPTNWDQPQTVTIRSARDNDTDSGSTSYKILAPGRISRALTAIQIDPDGVNLVVSPTILSVSAGKKSTFTVRLSRRPTGKTVVTIEKDVGGDPDLRADQRRLVFTPDNWDRPQSVAIRVKEKKPKKKEGKEKEEEKKKKEEKDEIRGAANFVLSAQGVLSQTVTASEARDVQPDLQISTESLLVVEGSSATFTIRLRKRPETNVRVEIEKMPGGDFHNELKLGLRHKQTLHQPLSAGARIVVLPKGTQNIIWFIAPEILSMGVIENPDLSAPRRERGPRFAISKIRPGQTVKFSGYEFIVPAD